MQAITNGMKAFGSVEGMDLYVARFLKKGTPAISKPCKFCMKWIRTYRIGKIHYIDINGKWISETIGD